MLENKGLTIEEIDQLISQKEALIADLRICLESLKFEKKLAIENQKKKDIIQLASVSAKKHAEPWRSLIMAGMDERSAVMLKEKSSPLKLLAERFALSVERTRQLRAKAIRILRHPIYEKIVESSEELCEIAKYPD